MNEELRLKDLREDHFYTQHQLCDKLNILRSTYSKYELEINTVPLDILCKLSNLYQVSIDYICGITNYRQPYGKYKEFNYSTLLENIKKLRLEKDYTQEQLSNELSCGQNTISEYENGERKISIDFVILLSKFYKVPTDYIIGIIDL